jgi:hypothetical protein
VRDVDPRVRDELERLLPPPDENGSDWNAVVRRLEAPAQRRRGRRRLVVVLAVAAAAVLGAAAVSPVGGAVARSVGDFSAWLAGVPGDPASEEAQRSFEKANALSWAAFPSGVQLRRLIAVKRAGATFELFGFRTGESLCLRLVATGIAGMPASSCAPLRELRSASAPALVLLTDHSFGERRLPQDALPGTYARSEASATFGIVADGVTQVVLHADDGDQRALVQSNAFLSVTSHPKPGTRVRRATALTREGRSHEVPLAQAPFGFEVGSTPLGEAYGPTQVERTVNGGTIGWVERREERGEPLSGEFDRLEEAFGRFEFARVLRPDPTSHMRVAITIGEVPVHLPGRRGDKRMCVVLIDEGGAGGGCSPYPGHSFPAGPVRVGTSVSGGGNQFATLSGAASDDVARLELFLATRERVAVPLRDNVFVVQAARTKFPVRLVAYDEDEKIIWVETLKSALGESGPTAVRGKQRIALKVEGPHGAQAVLRVGPSTDGGRCWRISYSDGSDGGGCPPKSYRGPVLDAALHPVWGDVFLEVEVREEVADVVIEQAGQEAVRRRPVEGFVIHPVDPAVEELFVTVRALAADGRELAKRGVRLRR